MRNLGYATAQDSGKLQLSNTLRVGPWKIFKMNMGHGYKKVGNHWSKQNVQNLAISKARKRCNESFSPVKAVDPGLNPNGIKLTVFKLVLIIFFLNEGKKDCRISCKSIAAVCFTRRSQDLFAVSWPIKLGVCCIKKQWSINCVK